MRLEILPEMPMPRARDALPDRVNGYFTGRSGEQNRTSGAGGMPTLVTFPECVSCCRFIRLSESVSGSRPLSQSMISDAAYRSRRRSRFRPVQHTIGMAHLQLNPPPLGLIQQGCLVRRAYRPKRLIHSGHHESGSRSARRVSNPLCQRRSQSFRTRTFLAEPSRNSVLMPPPCRSKAKCCIS